LVFVNFFQNEVSNNNPAAAPEKLTLALQSRVQSCPALVQPVFGMIARITDKVQWAG